MVETIVQFEGMIYEAVKKNVTELFEMGWDGNMSVGEPLYLVTWCKSINRPVVRQALKIKWVRGILMLETGIMDPNYEKWVSTIEETIGYSAEIIDIAYKICEIYEHYANK